ncbi:MAG: HTTM domain-containing protein, partial [Sandaracinaceae bacterium]|nr:HTTM domain-containing protein [Sandaracinaceae bacterium]
MMKAQGPAENASPFNRLLTPRFQALLGSLWVMVHVLIPLRYYLWPGHDRYDERFSWRMFSAVRVE